jgi:hypothetical protein
MTKLPDGARPSIPASKKEYALSRMTLAIDRLIDSNTKEKKQRAVKWVALWMKKWQSLPHHR